MNSTPVGNADNVQEILALDLSTTTPFVAWGIHNNIQILSHVSNAYFDPHPPQHAQHSEVLATLVEEVRTRIKGHYDNLSCIALNLGPGSFTGLRIALAFAKGLQAGLGCNIVGIDSMVLWAHICSTFLPLLTIIDARSKKFYCQFHHKIAPLKNTDNSQRCSTSSTIQDMTIIEIEKYLIQQYPHSPFFYVSGYGCSHFFDCLEESQLSTSTKLIPILPIPADKQDIGHHLLQLGLQKFLNKLVLEKDITPIYIRNAT